MERLDDYFRNVLTEGDAVKLMQYCWLNLTLHFALRGSEVQIQLKKSDIKFEKDGKGEEYVVLSTDFMSKICRGGIDGRSFQTCGRMQEEKQVSAMQLLLEKLHPEVERLFQRALMGKQSLKKPVWFARMPLGKVVVQDMMPRISMHADLSVRYTNHCVRATSVVLLKKAGFEDREVCFITGHSNPKSLSSYSQPDEEMKAKMALALDTKPISENSNSLVVSLSENTNEKETSDCAERTGWNSPERRSTTPPPEILLSPATNTPAGIVFNAPNNSLHNVTINLGHRTNRSTLR